MTLNKGQKRLVAGGIGLLIGGAVVAYMLFSPQNGTAGHHEMEAPAMSASDKASMATIPVKAERIDDKGWARGDMIMGDPNAPVTIVEYASLSCPHCASFHAATFPALKRGLYRDW